MTYVYFVAFTFVRKHRGKRLRTTGNAEVVRPTPIERFEDVASIASDIASDDKIPSGASVEITNWILLRTEGAGPEKC